MGGRWVGLLGRRRLWVAAVAAAGVVAASCYGCEVHTAQRYAAQDAEASRELGRYLEKVRDHDFAGAYQRLCSDVLPGYSETEHARFLRSQPALGSFELGDPVRRSGLEGTFLVYPAYLAHIDGSSTTTWFVVGLEVDGPKVCDAFDWRG